MNGAINITVLAQLIFIIMLTAASMTDGYINLILYLLAFIVPTLAATVMSKKKRSEIFGYLKMDKRSFLLFLPTAMPILALIIVTALLTTFILSLFGAENSVTIYDTLGENLLRHALIPAVFEELLFRYIPLILIAPYSKKWAVIISAATFAASHMSLFQIPYALLAGGLFILLDIASGSIFPSLILHLLNNTLSVLSLYYKIDYPIIISVLVLAAISSSFVFKKRDKYKKLICDIFDEECDEKVTYSPLLLIIPCILVAIINII